MPAPRSSSLGRLALAARHPPLWARWVLTVLVFAVLFIVVRAIVRSGGSPAPERSAEVQANQEGEVVIAEDQAPHTAPLGPGAPVQAALVRAITADTLGRIRHGELTGPFQGVSCRAAGASHSGRRPFHCTARAASLAYPFFAVADEREHLLTWCKRDPPPTSDAPLNVPLSTRCLA